MSAAALSPLSFTKVRRSMPPRPFRFPTRRDSQSPPMLTRPSSSAHRGQKHVCRTDSSQRSFHPPWCGTRDGILVAVEVAELSLMASLLLLRRTDMDVLLVTLQPTSEKTPF